MAHFKRVTMGRPLILGRRTYDSIGGPLPGRFPVVLSRDASFHASDGVVARDLAEALAQGEAIGRREGSPEIMVAGGASIYAALLPHATTLLITRVDLDPDGDAVFPPIDPDLWRMVENKAQNPGVGDEAAYSFMRYERQPGDKALESSGA